MANAMRRGQAVPWGTGAVTIRELRVKLARSNNPMVPNVHGPAPVDMPASAMRGV